MFKKEKTSTGDKLSTSATMIAAGTVLKGDIQSDNDLRIDGTIHGHVISTSKIVIGATGFVEGNIEGQQADIAGRVQGNISVKELLQLRGLSEVNGNLQAEKLQIDQTAVFNGQCQMGAHAHIVKMDRMEEQAVAQ